MAKIMYIEDNEPTRASMTTLLERKGHSVVAREDTVNAYGLAEQWQPDLIITDNDLGEGKETGITFALKMKEKGYKIAVLSGNNEACNQAAAAEIPFFMKPYLFFDLLKEMGI